MHQTKDKCSQNTIIWLCWFVYTLAYLGRYSYNANINLIMNDFGVNHAAAGMVTTCFFFAYGIGQVVNGFLCRRYNKKILFPIVLFSSSVINLLVFVVPFGLLKYMWFVNGILQSCLWASIITILGENLDGRYLNRAFVIMSTTATAGTIFAYGSSAFFVWLDSYRMMFVFAPIVMCIVAIIWLAIFKSTPKDTDDKKENKNKEKAGAFKFVSVLFIIMAFYASVDNLVKDGLSTWVPAILTEEYGMKNEVSIISSIVLPLLGTVGGLMTVYLSKCFKNFIGLSAGLFAVSAAFIFIIMKAGKYGPWLMILCFGIVVCMMHGVNNIITSIAPLKMRGNTDPGKIAGLLNGFCYLGSTLSSYGLGTIADKSGWQTVFFTLLILSVICVIVGILYIPKSKMKNAGDDDK